MSKTIINASAKTLQVLDVLGRNFAGGFSNGELAKATGLSASQVTRHVATLEARGFAERVPDTDRIRMSHRMAQVAVQLLNSLDNAAARAEESKQRLTRT